MKMPREKRRKSENGLCATDQIMYMPQHVKGDVDHPDVEIGFIVGITYDRTEAFCRYFQKGSKTEFRTRANSECTPVNCLSKLDHKDRIDQEIVDEWLEDIVNGRDLP